MEKKRSSVLEKKVESCTATNKELSNRLAIALRYCLSHLLFEHLQPVAQFFMSAYTAIHFLIQVA